MKLRAITISVLLIGILIFQTLPAIAANNDDLNRLTSTNSCSGCDVSRATLKEADLSKADLSRTDLSGADLTKAILKAADLSHANLQGTKLQNTNLSGINLSGADLSNAQLSGAILSNADLTGANLSNAELKGARFWGFAGFANLSSANLSGAQLQGVDLSKIKLSDANLTNADLSGGSSLREALLNGANLSNANLTQANLINARLNHANLTAAQLTGANLKKANLTGANLTNADLREINLTNAILTDALGLDPYAEQLAQKATNAANQEDYLGAIAYLQQIPPQTKIYSEAQIQTDKYEEAQRIKEQQQLDSEASQLLKNANLSADSSDYRKAIRTLNRVSEKSSSYTEAQKEIAFYSEKQQAKEKAEQAEREAARIEREKQIAQAQAEEAARSIGVSRSTIQSLFEQPALGFQFSSSTPLDGQPRVFGKSKDGSTLIELIGPSENLRKATIMTELAKHSQTSAVYLLAFIKKTSPGWNDSVDWLQNNVKLIGQGSKDEAVTTYGNQRIKLELFESIGTLMISVEAQG